QWQPAVVSWVQVGNTVGWVPLAPQDRPGQTPANLQHGLLTTMTQLAGTKPAVTRLDRNQKPQVLSAPPAGLPGSPTPSAMAVHPAAPPRSVPAGHVRRMIVFDPSERKFVNNPGAPAHPTDKGNQNTQTGASPAPRGVPRSAPPPPRIEAP